MKSLIFALCLLMTINVFAAKSKVTKEERAKVSRYFEANGLGDGDTNVVSEKGLKGAAKEKYEKLSAGKDCKAFGYCPEVYAINAYGTETLSVSVADDGGVMFTVYTKDGEEITSCGQSESGDMRCGG